MTPNGSGAQGTQGTQGVPDRAALERFYREATATLGFGTYYGLGSDIWAIRDRDTVRFINVPPKTAKGSTS